MEEIRYKSLVKYKDNANMGLTRLDVNDLFYTYNFWVEWPIFKWIVQVSVISLKSLGIEVKEIKKWKGILSNLEMLVLAGTKNTLNIDIGK